MDIFVHFKSIIVDILTDMGHADLDFSRINTEPPRDKSHGDIATNAAMVLAKPLGLKPRDLALKIAESLQTNADIEKVDVAGPGFINISVADGFYTSRFAEIVARKEQFGKPEANGKKLILEFTSANPTGPVHIGHVRGTVFGDSLANLLQWSGYDVFREYYVNDAGGQIVTLARSAFLRYRECLGDDIGQIPQGYYPGEYLKPVGQDIVDKFGDKLKSMPEAEWLPLIRDLVMSSMMKMIKQDLELLDVKFDNYFSESELHASGAIDKSLADMRARGLVYEGVLPPPKGQLPDDYEEREQTLFRATDWGDDIDRPLIKSDGSYTYFAADIAYHRDKYMRGFNEQIDVLGADHGGYVKRLKAIVRAVSNDEAELDVKICQIVKLVKNGEVQTMSKRSGNFITLKELHSEVGKDPIRFMMLYRKNEAPLDFDYDKVTEKSRDNPVFYVQYAHARVHSIMRQAKETLANFDMDEFDFTKANLALLTDSSEIGVIKSLLNWPKTANVAAEFHEPHRISFYLYELAAQFHSLWNKGKEMPQLRFIVSEDEELTHARLALVRSVAYILKAGLDILGVNTPKEMR
ncbi:MAG: arginine--tRNA ligase [Rhizobiales bacterium]|nr:arginine--tRNA ligase [Hyphomicrobiales bacterium]NRB14991.1 arginine--tRNA ligase [Hyphomicrobiales bacterium]